MRHRVNDNYDKNTHIIGASLGNYAIKQSLEQALSKTREVRARKLTERGSFDGVIHVPQILVGHKIKLILVE